MQNDQEYKIDIPKNMKQPGKIEFMGQFFGYRNIAEGLIWAIPWALICFNLFSGYIAFGLFAFIGGLGFVFLAKGTEEGDSLLSVLGRNIRFNRQARNWAAPTLEDIAAFHEKQQKERDGGNIGEQKQQ